MRFYRVVLHTDAGVSAGFGWATSMDGARAIAREAINNDPQEYREYGPPEIEPVNITPNRAGILSALIKYASHEANG
jgi:hypothetical protein